MTTREGSEKRATTHFCVRRIFTFRAPNLCDDAEFELAFTEDRNLVMRPRTLGLFIKMTSSELFSIGFYLLLTGSLIAKSIVWLFSVTVS